MCPASSPPPDVLAHLAAQELLPLFTLSHCYDGQSASWHARCRYLRPNSRKRFAAMVGPRNYPLAIASGVALLLLSLMGGAAITGVLQTSGGEAGEPAPLEKTA